MLGSKKCWFQNQFASKKIFGQQIFESKQILCQKIWLKKIRSKKFWVKKLWVQKLLAETFSILHYLIIEMGTFLKNRDPPLCFQNSQMEIGTFLGGFTRPPPFGTLSQIFSFFLVTPPLRCMQFSTVSACKFFWCFS